MLSGKSYEKHIVFVVDCVVSRVRAEEDGCAKCYLCGQPEYGLRASVGGVWRPTGFFNCSPPGVGTIVRTVIS